MTICHGLKLETNDGKYRLTVVVYIEEMFRIIESISSKNMKKYYIECSKSEKVQTSSAQIPWSHNMFILDQIEDNIQRVWYKE